MSLTARVVSLLALAAVVGCSADPTNPTCTPECTPGVCTDGCGGPCPCEGQDGGLPPADGGDAGETEPDASSADAGDAGSELDAGPLTSPATAQVSSGDDALASYLINASPAAWNIFWGATVPLGRHFDAAHVSYHTALRFPDVTVPKDATITSARLSFYPANSVDASNNLWLNVYAERAGDSAPFDPTNYVAGRPDQRPKTTAFIDHWLVRCNASCTDVTEYDCPQRKLDCWDQDTAFTCPKDLKALVQEVVNLPDWEAHHALTILLINAATEEDGAKYQNARSITGHDPARGAAFAPKLVVEWTP